MSLKINVIGKSLDEIRELTRNCRRERLLELLEEVGNIEPHYSPRTVARAREMSARTIVALCQAGKIPGTHKPMQNGWRISRSGLREWDRNTCVTPVHRKEL